nr:MAG TPA: hypothetical protein [Caudoviricetes sp.]
MTTKQLVNLCNKTKTCANCSLTLYCWSYFIKYGNIPSGMNRKFYRYTSNVPPEAYSNHEITINKEGL